MPTLHIYDSSDSHIRQTANARGLAERRPIPSVDHLVADLDRLVAGQARYDRILFETHGSPGMAAFGHRSINAAWWRGVRNRNYHKLTRPNARIYFNGCNVAETDAGWDFLEAAAVTLLSGGGEVFGQTSRGYGNPFNGHVVHFWGSTRRLLVGFDGRVIDRYEV